MGICRKTEPRLVVAVADHFKVTVAGKTMLPHGISAATNAELLVIDTTNNGEQYRTVTAPVCRVSLP